MHTWWSTTKWNYDLNSSPIDELGIWCLTGQQGPEHFRHSKEVSMATVWAGTTPASVLSISFEVDIATGKIGDSSRLFWPATGPYWQHCSASNHHLAPSHWKEFSGKILTLPYTYLNSWIMRAGGPGARIRNDSQKAIENTSQQPEVCQDQLKNANDPQRWAEMWHKTYASLRRAASS